MSWLYSQALVAEYSAATGMAYAFVCGEMIMRENWPLAVVWGGYALAQCGLYAITRAAL